MSKVKEFLRKYGYGAWLGFSLAVSGITVLDWRFYFIAFPVAALVLWRVYGEPE